MEIQTYNKLSQHQPFKNPYETVQKLHGDSTWSYKYVSPMELLRLLWGTESAHLDLTTSERAVLSVLLNHVNLGKAKREGVYEAFPSVQTIVDFTGIGERTVGQNKKSLKEKDWIRMHSGTGMGRSNHYYINAPKLVGCYKLANPDDEKLYRTGRGYSEIKSEPFPINRDTSGLMRGRSAPSQVRASVQ